MRTGKLLAFARRSLLLSALVLMLGSIFSPGPATASLITYELDGASFSFFPVNSSVLATVDMTGTFVVDVTVLPQVFVAVDITLSGLPPGYTLLNDNFNSILNSYDFLNAPDDDTLIVQFLNAHGFDPGLASPLLDVTLTCQACPGAGIFTQSVTGSADPVPEPSSLILIFTALGTLLVSALVARRRPAGRI